MKPATCVATIGLLLALGASPSLSSGPGSADRLSFWDTQRRGANLFNEVETRDRFRAAREAGLEWVRLVPDKWKAAARDFLIGDAGDFQGVVMRASFAPSARSTPTRPSSWKATDTAASAG